MNTGAPAGDGVYGWTEAPSLLSVIRIRDVAVCNSKQDPGAGAVELRRRLKFPFLMGAGGLIAASVVIGATQAAAAGFDIRSQNAQSMGAAMAGAQAARATPGNAFYNPAAINGVAGFETSSTVSGSVGFSNYEGASATLLGFAPVQGQTTGDGVLQGAVFPVGASAFPVNDRITIGATVNVPFGLSSNYAEQSVLRYHGTESKSKTLALTTILGVELNDDWSVAGGLRIQYFDFSATAAIDAAGIATALTIPGFTPGADDAFIALNTDDIGFGYVFGFQGAISDRLRIGASYTSKIDHNFDGDATFDLRNSAAAQALTGFGLLQDTGFSSTLTTPAMTQAGFEFDASPALTLLGSVAFTEWTSFEEIAAFFDNPAQPPDIVTQDFDDVWSYSAGAEYQVSPAFALRAGIMIEDSPVNDAFASPRIPDGDRLWLAAGFSQDVNERAALHFGVNYVINETREINQSGAAPENLSRGSAVARIESNLLILGLGVDFKF